METMESRPATIFHVAKDQLQALCITNFGPIDVGTINGTIQADDVVFADLVAEIACDRAILWLKVSCWSLFGSARGLP